MDVSSIFSLTNSRKRYECLDWKKIFKLTDRLLAVAKDCLKAGNPKETADMAIEWLQTFDKKFDEDIFMEYDEDGWRISETCKEWTEIIESAMSDANTTEEVKQAILNDIEKLSDCGVYWNYGFLDIATFIKRMKANNATGDEALEQLDELIKRERGVNEYNTRLPELVFRKVNILRELGKNEEAEQAILEDIRNRKICEQYVGELVEKKEYDKALCALDVAISKLEEIERLIYMDDFLELKLNIYKTIGDDKNITDTLRELFKASYGDFKYYKALKERIPANEWKEYLAKLMAETDFRESLDENDTNSKAEIFLEENDLQGLADYIKKIDNFEIFDICRIYVPELPDNLIAEVIPYYADAIREEAKEAGGSPHYERIAGYIRELARWKGGRQTAVELIAEFLAMYSNRSAMKRVLNRLIKRK